MAFVPVKRSGACIEPSYFARLAGCRRELREGTSQPSPGTKKSLLEYTAKYDLTGGVHTVTFTAPFLEAPSVLVTPCLSNTQDDGEAAPVAPTVYDLTTRSFSVRFCAVRIGLQSHRVMN